MKRMVLSTLIATALFLGLGPPSPDATANSQSAPVIAHSVEVASDGVQIDGVSIDGRKACLANVQDNGIQKKIAYLEAKQYGIDTATSALSTSGLLVTIQGTATPSYGEIAGADYNQRLVNGWLNNLTAQLRASPAAATRLNTGKYLGASNVGTGFLLNGNSNHWY